MQFSVAVLLALPLLAVATPTPQDAGTCTTSPVSCCEATFQPTPDVANELSSLLGVVLDDITALVGLGCSPISVVGVGSGAACTQSPVCCTSNDGVISLGCVPVTL
ncbi:hypothetical protein NM688_g7696 [Phlebia brevispora]|uniref:Uncharacterized protein n=1 Tax=Phlebia brevispora TaxID=194682 RepID=A0ACC1S238_9APHY|nr:hypothetical protein NM688_g7696 [Phlebia brevispora]